MSNTKLKHRFSKDVKQVWQGWHECMRCGKNGWDALHHIISPTDQVYIPGSHNSSVLNSCPIHNAKCHLWEEGSLGKDIPKLLQKTIEGVQFQRYTLKAKDQKFLDKYEHVYPKSGFW